MTNDSVNKPARRVRQIASTMCVLLMLAVPCVPFVYRWLNPPKTPSHQDGFWGFITGAFDVLGSFTDGIAMLVMILGLGAAAFLASLIALIASCVAKDPLWIRGLCALPVLTATVLALFTVVLPLMGVG